MARDSLLIVQVRIKGIKQSIKTIMNDDGEEDEDEDGDEVDDDKDEDDDNDDDVVIVK